LRSEHPRRIAVVSDPAAIRRIFVDNTTNYRKDPLQKRVLGPGIRDGLLDVEGDDWRVQRRTLAPLFTPRTVASFARAMNAAAEDLVSRWMRLREGGSSTFSRKWRGLRSMSSGAQSFRTGSARL